MFGPWVTENVKKTIIHTENPKDAVFIFFVIVWCRILDVNFVLSCPCYAVGTILGAMTGALIGQETESGFVRGASVGAISGAVYSIEVFESSLLLWQSDESGIQCLLYLIDVIVSLLSGRLVRERIGPAMLSAVQSQMGAVETTFEDVPDIFDTGGANGLLVDTVEKFPKIRVARDDIVDTSGEGVSCSVCLQDFQLGETVRSLPHCHHLFHLPCIDSWPVRHGSCPLCRRVF
ncbi:NEP1-interacting protein-like 1 [Primulina tabacum]|uniref:NEP1-interacting protein-like 1 n=1 Tax=Primulina tabacum TaxID=48773 RepID=UPI003F5A8889